MINISAALVCLGACLPPPCDEPAIQQACRLMSARYERLENCLRNYSMTCSSYRVSRDGMERLVAQKDVFVAGPRRLQVTIHMRPRYETLELAKRFDDLRNTLLIDRQIRTFYREGTRQAWIDSQDSRLSSGLYFDDFWDLLMICPDASHAHLNDSVNFLGSDGVPRTCRWVDLYLPHALNQPGWTESAASSPDPASLGLLSCMSRRLAPDVTDRIWFDRAKGHALVRRDFTFGAGRRLTFEFGDFVCLFEDFQIPMSCRTQSDNVPIVQRVSCFRPGAPPSDRFTVPMKSGTIVSDSRSNTSTTLPGGEDLLDELVARWRYLYGPFRTTRPAISRLGLLGWGLVVPLAVFAGSRLFLHGTQGGRIIPSGSGRRSGSAGRCPRTQARRGFTVIEALVVIFVIGVLAALLLPAVQSARESARRMTCASNLRQIGLAIHEYSGVYGQLPIGRPARSPAHRVPGFSALVAILPFMENQVLYSSFNQSSPPYSVQNLTAELARPGIFVCPSDPGSEPPLRGVPRPWPPVNGPPGGWPVSVTSYALLYGTLDATWEVFEDPSYDPYNQIDGCFNDRQSIRFSSITDGLSSTVFASERAMSYINRERTSPIGEWTGSAGLSTLIFAERPPNRVFLFAPNDMNIKSYYGSASSSHAGSVNVLMGDSCVRRVLNSVNSWPLDPTGRPVGVIPVANGFVNVPPRGVWQAIATRAGGESVGNF